jgi:hypothetical protein
MMDFDLTASIAVLERTPAVLRAMLGGLPPAWTDATEGPGTWSPFDVVGHLLQGERENWIPRARIILDQAGESRFEPFDRFAQLRANEGKTLDALLDDFTALRAQNVATLAGWNVSDAQLALTGEHPEFGTVTLRQLLATWTVHDLTHLAQIARVMAKQYAGEVGPWQAYLSILHR